MILLIRSIGARVKDQRSCTLTAELKMQQPKEQSIRKKLGSILGLGASKTTPTPQKTIEDLGKLEHSTFITDDVLRVCFYYVIGRSSVNFSQYTEVCLSYFNTQPNSPQVLILS